MIDNITLVFYNSHVDQVVPFMPYREIIQSVMGLVYSVPISVTTDGGAREFGAWMRHCLNERYRIH